MLGPGVPAPWRARLALATAAGAAEVPARPVVPPGSSAIPAWAADGSRLVFHSRRQDDTSVLTTDEMLFLLGEPGVD
jgi:dipeptidyl aminopeptidase/acylaminoacyl peptidase